MIRTLLNKIKTFFFPPPVKCKHVAVSKKLAEKVRRRKKQKGIDCYIKYCQKCNGYYLVKTRKEM